jgi:glycosyltransferase involved in cell wall biosynthesis
MKLAFDAKRALNNYTGLGNHARILLNALIRDYPKNDYILFSPTAKDELLQQLEGRFKIIFPESGLARVLHPYWRSYAVNSQLRQNKADIYHGLSNEIPIQMGKSCIRNVVTIHDLIFLKHTEQYSFADRKIYEWKTRYAAKHAHKIIAVSRETKEDLIERYKVPEKMVEVIYPSVDARFQTFIRDMDAPAVRSKYSLPDKYILNVGSFFPRKNQRTLIEAFDIIRNKVEEDLVLVGGYGHERKPLEELIQRKQLQNRARIVSNVSNNDLPDVYRAASLFVFPSLYEGFGAPVLEALFSKIPVIATKGGAIEEAAGKESLFVNPLSAEEIASKMLLVLKDNTLRKRMVEGGYLHCQTMTDIVFARKTMNLYKEVIG